MKIKGYLVIAAICGALVSLLLADLPEIEAAVPVVDTANINQQHLTYLQTLQTALNTARQITLQIQELKSLPETILNDYKSVLNSEVNMIRSTLSQTSGILNPQKTLDSVWNSAFKPAGNVTANNYTSATASAVNNSTIAALDQTNYDSFSVVKTALKNIDQTQKNLDQLMTLSQSAEGQKQSAQINNMLLAEQAKLLQQQNIIRAAEATARISYFQRQNQLDALAQAQNEKAAESIRNMNTNVPVFQ